MSLKVNRGDFPIFKNNPKLVYLDSSATSQKPKIVIEAIEEWYTKHNANIHRGAYRLAEEATFKYEAARKTVAKFLGAKSSRQIVFTKGATEAINLVAWSWARHNLLPGDKIMVTKMEHHANLVPWQHVAEQSGFKLEFLDITKHGELDLTNLDNKLKGIKLLALPYVSNVLGTINPVEQIIKIAHKQKIPILLDAAQAVGHFSINVTQLNVDWLVFSGHKTLGPTGIGVLYAKRERFEEMRPFEVGGDMIQTVTLRRTKYKTYPWLFEAGTQHLAGVVGLAKALDYLKNLDLSCVKAHDKMLVKYTLDKLQSLPEIRVVGPLAPSKRGALISFVVRDIHPHDLATMLDEDGIAIRAGHHCAEPLHKELGVSATARVSFHIYNSQADIDKFIISLKKIIQRWQTYIDKK